MSETKVIRVGIIGAGIGRKHAQAFRQVPGVEVTAVCSRQPDKAQAFAEEYSVPHCFTQASELIASDLDLVVVAAPNRDHHPLTLEALSRGRHVLCEKPLASSVPEAQEMVAAAKRADRLLAIHLNRRMFPGVMALRQAHDRGDLGQVDHVRATWHRQAGIPAREGFLTRERAGGGCLLDLGVHMLDQALFLQGYPEVTEVRAHLHRRFFDQDIPDLRSDVEDSAFCFLSLETGGSITLEISWASTHSNPEERTLQVYGSKLGALRVVHGDGDSDQFFSLHDRRGPSSNQGTPKVLVPTVQADLISALREGRPPQCTGAQGLFLMKVLEALYQSHRTGATVSPLPSQPQDG